MTATAAATRAGTQLPSGDAYAVHTLANGTTAAAVVDGIGHTPPVVATARLLADVAARIAARRSPLAGLLTASELIADPGDGDDPEPDAVAIVAVTAPDDDTIRLAWTGDCRAYTLTNGRLQQLTVDHTLAEQLEMCGYSGEITRPAGQWVRTTLATAVVATVNETWTEQPLVVLTTDGVHDQMPHDRLQELVLTHQHDPRALATALVAAAQPGPGGVRDDATALVIRTTR